MRIGFLILISFLLSFPAMASEPVTGEMSMPMCTEIGCEDGVVFKSNPDKKWEPGDYDFFIMIDGIQVICKGSLPLKPCGEGATFKCSNTKVTIGESGCALPEAEQGISDVRMQGSPKNVILRMSYNREVQFLHKIKPVYTETRPNGPLCEPVCSMAVYDLETGQ